MKIIKYLSISSIILILGINYSFWYDNELKTASGWDIILDVKFNDVSPWNFTSFSTWVIKMINTIDTLTTNYTNKINISYSWTLTWIEFWYVSLNTWIFPAWFLTYTPLEIETYLIDNICKNNSNYDFSYSSYSWDEIELSYSNMEWTSLARDKSLILCSKSDNWKYWAFWMGYTLKKELAIFWNAWTWYSFDEIFNNYKLTFFSSWLPKNNHLYKYYVIEGWGNCSNNKNNYVNSLDWDEITKSEWEVKKYIPLSDWNKEILVCFWVIENWNNLIYTEWKKLKFKADKIIPNITITTNDWNEVTWYNNVARNITIKCSDENINSCGASYWWDSYTWTKVWPDYIIDITLNKIWNNEVFINAVDKVLLNNTLSKSYKIDDNSPSISIYFDEIVNPATNIITSIKVKAICNDASSWCNNNDIVWWTQWPQWTYEKTYTSNVSDFITVTDNTWNNYTQNFTIFNINKSVSNFYWLPYSNVEYKEINISWPFTSCWVPSSCDRNSPANLCSTFQASINPDFLNGYDIYNELGAYKYKANHKLYSTVIVANKIKCSYYDWKSPDFTETNQIVNFSTSWPTYSFNWLTDEWGSWLKKITIIWEKEAWTPGPLTGNQIIDIPNVSVENSYKAWSWILLSTLSATSLADYDSVNKWYWRIKLEIKVEDWSWNFKVKNDYIYVVPWQIDLSKSITPTKNWNEYLWQVIADWTSSYWFNIDLKDSFWNKIKDYDIPLVGSRTISTASTIQFKNTAEFLNEPWNPIYYKWPWSSIFINTSNSFSINDNILTQNWWFDINISSLVPTNESWYPYWRWDVYLKEFKINDSRNWIIDLWTSSLINSKLKFQPLISAELINFPNVINDNTNYQFQLKFIKNSTIPTINISNFWIDFNFSNSWWLFKRFLFNGIEKYSKSWITSFTLNPCNLSIADTCKMDINMNLDSNWLSFWDSLIDFNLIYSETTINSKNTSYKLIEQSIWADQFKKSNIEIKWILTNDKDSKWLWLTKDWTNTISFDKEWFDKSILSMNLKKNVEKYTKNITNLANLGWNKTLNFSSTPVSFTHSSWEKIYYYDFTWMNCSNSYNASNDGCNVKISNTKQLIDWHVNIIIKWWNLLIDTDMYYNSKDDLIWYFVFREENTKVWWNIYITPKPTNINWILYAEWSIMSVDNWNPTKVFHKWNTNATDLNKQLLWFWSIYSANTVWWSIDYEENTDKKLACPYNTDIYVINNWNVSWCNSEEATKYDLSKLRRFTSVDWYFGNCDWSKFWIDWNWAKVLTSFIWGKTCFSDTWDTDLKKIDNDSSSLVIIYDTNSKINPLLLLKNQ